MIIKGQKAPVGSHNRGTSLNSTNNSKYTGDQRHYPGLLKPQGQIKMAQIFDNQMMNQENYDGSYNSSTNKQYYERPSSQPNGENKNEQEQNIIDQFKIIHQTQDNTNGNNMNTMENSIPNKAGYHQQNTINFPQLIPYNSSNNSILLPQSQNVQSHINGIGPGGFEMNSFFTNKNMNEVQVILENHNQNQGKNSPKQFEKEIIQGILNQDFNILTTNQSNNHTQHIEFSPDNTQYTILKAKLFNPNIKDEGTSMSSKQITNAGRPQDSVVSPTKNSLIHSQQFHVQQNFYNQSIQQQNSIHTNNSTNVQPLGLISKQQTMPQPQYNKNPSGTQIISLKAKQGELAKQLRHKKDMQQLKFYQTLTNQPNTSSTYSTTNKINQSIQSSTVGYTHLNTSVVTANQQQVRPSINQNASLIKNQAKMIQQQYQQQNEMKQNQNQSLSQRRENRTRSGQIIQTAQAGTSNPYINIQNHFTFADGSKINSNGGNSNRPLTTSNPYPQYKSTYNKTNPIMNNSIYGRDLSPIEQSVQNKRADTLGPDAQSHNNGSFGGQTQIGLGGGDVQTQLTHNEKSYTQLLSDNSRENYMLRSNMNSKENIQQNIEFGKDASQGSVKKGRNQSIDNNYTNLKDSLLQETAKQTELNLNSTRRRQMISIEKVEKKRVLSESQEQVPMGSVISHNPNDIHHNLSMAIALDDPNANHNQSLSYPNQISSSNYMNQRKKNQIENLSMELSSQQQSRAIQNLIIKKCEFKSRPEPPTNKTQYYSAQRNSLKIMRNMEKLKKLEKEMSQDQIGAKVYQGGVELYKAESQLILRENKQQPPLKKKEKQPKEDKHKACQRFLERGNNPVPPKYEEQDVLPLIDQQRETSGQFQFRSSSKNKHYSRQVMHFANKQILGGVGGTVSGFNFDDFDEEINGINLGKLFSIYGPNSVENKKNWRKNPHQVQELRNSQRDGLRSGRSTSLNYKNKKDLDLTFPHLKDINNTFSDLERSKDDSYQNDEPIVIRLMANIFSKKKSVKERLLMLPNISIEKLRQEIKQMTMEEKVYLQTLSREQFFKERQQLCEKLFKNFPKDENKFEKEYSKLYAHMELQQIDQTKQNPFYYALKANKDQREKMKLLRKLKLEEEIRIRERQIEEDELRRKAKEKDKTQIFSHTFVDYEDQANLNTQEQEYKGDIMNRPPKDVFSFMNLNFELPISYYQAFGDFNLPTENQKSIIKEFMLNHWSQMRSKKVNFKIAFDNVKQVFNVILLGKNCPLSKCCKMTVNFQFDKDIGGKVICMETLCPYNPLDQFFMDVEIIEELFSENQRHLMQVQSDLMLQQMDQQMAKPKVKKVLASEVSKSIQNGIYKNKSLREVLLTRQALGNFNPRKKRKPITDLVSQLFSDDGGEYSQYQPMMDEQDNEENYRVIRDRTIEEAEDEGQNKWNDIEPVKQYDTPTGEAPICPVQYSPQYVEVMGYFRAILIKKELSLRALELTEDVLKFNAGDYDAWALRRKIIDALSLPLKDELDFLTEIGLYLEKNFQIWHHRRCIMELHQKDFDCEKEFLYEVYESDKKNYHAWSYKLWLVERFQLWDDYEWEFIDEELTDEVTNNSIWSYRYFLLNKTKAFTKEVIQQELEYTLGKLELDMANEAAWAYLRGFLAVSEQEVLKSKVSNAKRWLILDFPFLKNCMHQLLEKNDINKGNRFIYMVLIDFAVAENDRDTQLTYLTLLKKIDRMRENYYQWRINKLQLTSQ